MAPKRGKTYRTSSGQQVDFGALLLNNETVPALGNMNVNARGDEIAPDGSITKSREDIMREYNELNTMVPQDGAIPEGTGLEADDDWQDWEPPVTTPDPAPVANMSVPTTEVTSQGQDSSKAAVAPVGTNVGQQIADQAEAEAPKTPTGGLAAAVAAAKKPESNVQQSAQTQEKEKSGVRRI
jgi:hypothetical protein